jgi:integrase
MAKATLTNDLSVRNLKAKRGAGFTEYADKSNRGLLLRVSANGHKTWYYRYRDGGKRRFVPLGQYPVTSVADALAAYTDRKESDTDPWTEHQAEKKGEAARLTLEQLADKYIEDYAKPYKRSWKGDEALLDRNVLGRVEGFPVPPIADKKADEITRQDLLRVVGKVADRGAWVEARKTARVLSKLFNWAMEKGHISHSPASRLAPKPPVPVRQRQAEKAEQTLNQGDIAAVWNALRKESEPWASVLAFMLLTGQRPGEVCGMEWKHVDLNKADWHMPITKNGKPHTVPLPDAAVSFLTGIKRKGRHVFPANTKSGHLETDQLARKFGAVLASLDLEHRTPHRIRATVATGIEALGVDHRHIMALLNHTPQDITSQRCAKHDYYTEKRRALTHWCAELDRIVNDRDEVVVSIRR